MQIVTLLVDPARPSLDPALAEAVRNAWGGGTVLWLAPDEACEFPVPEVPGNRWEVWGELQGRGVDLVVQPEAGRRKRLLLADMDSTMIRQECIDELADLAGVGERVAAITARAMNGELDFEAALVARMALLAGLDEGVIERVWGERIEMAPGAEALIATLRRDGVRTVLVSGGFTAFTERVAAALGFDTHHANRLEVEGGRLTGRVVPPILGREAKVATLRAACERLGIGVAEAMAVGDGANDLGMIGVAGTGVALHAKPAVAAAAEVRITHGDLTALLYIQGYARDDFAVSSLSR